VVCDGDEGHRMLADSTSYSSYSHSSYSSSGDDEPGKTTDDGGTAEYCDAAPSKYVHLTCLSHVVQYLAQQLSLPLHEGAANYIWHFFNYSKRSVYYIIGTKIATVAGMLALAMADHHLRSHELLLAILAITVVQGLTQTLENMIMHVRKQESLEGQHKKIIPERSLSSFYRTYGEKSGSIVPKSWLKWLARPPPDKTASHAASKSSIVDSLHDLEL
jgi:hypothetical protein